KGDGVRVTQPGADRVGKFAEKRARLAIEAQNVAIVGAGDVDVEAARVFDGRREDHAARTPESACDGRNKIIYERAGNAIETNDPSRATLMAIADVEVLASVAIAVWAEEDLVDFFQVAGLCEFVDEFPGGAAVAEDGPELTGAAVVATADVKVVVVRPEDG